MEHTEDATAHAMRLFEQTASVLKELPRTSGGRVRSSGDDSHFSLEDDLALLKHHWFNVGRTAVGTCYVPPAASLGRGGAGASKSKFTSITFGW